MYLTVMRTLERPMLKKRLHLKKQWILHHDNARTHTARIITDYLKKMKIRVMPHPPYSPDEAPCDFYLFPFLKKELHGQTLVTIMISLVFLYWCKSGTNTFSYIHRKVSSYPVFHIFAQYVLKNIAFLIFLTCCNVNS